jgi:Tfp pilus assembly protein PilE
MHARRTPTSYRLGLTLIEVAAGVGALALLFALGVSFYRGARLSLHAAEAQANLRQVGTCLELYFRKYGGYPPQGSDLGAALGPFSANPRIFANPLMDEAEPGDTMNALYRAPTLAEIDSPNNYVTALVSDNGHTVVVLRTGGRIERRDDLAFDPANLAGVLATLTGSAPPAPGHQIGGEININPRNNSDYEFELRKPDGSIITRDDLQNSNGQLDYTGPATWIRFCPKGNGNQNGLTLDGAPYPLQNGTRYTIETLQGGTIQVHLYNDNPNGKGKSMGKWWMTITASGSSITPG